MSNKQIATSALWQIGSQVVMAALSILTVKFVAIGLTKELAGNYNSAYGYLQLFGILADFGLYAVAVREVSKAEDKSAMLGAILVLRIVILLLSFSAAIAIVWILPQWKGTPLPLSVVIASFVPFFTLLAGIIRTIFQVEYRMHVIFIAEVTQRIITTGLIGLLIFLGISQSANVHHLYLMLFFGGVGAFFLFVVLFFYGNRIIPIRPSLDIHLIKRLLSKAAPFGFAYLCVAIYRQFDVTLIAILRDDFELQNAYYGFVVRMADMGFILPTFLLNSTLPILSERDAKGEDTSRLLGKTFTIIMLIGSIAFLFAALWSRPLVHLLTTQQYLSTALQPGSDTALRLISVPLLLNGIILYSFYVLLNRHVWKRLVTTLCLAALLSLAINIFLIPMYGFVGAAYTSILIHCILAIFLLPQALHEMKMTISFVYIRAWFFFTAALAMGLHLFSPLLVNDLNTVIGLCAMTILMVALGWGLKLHKLLL